MCYIFSLRASGHFKNMLHSQIGPAVHVIRLKCNVMTVSYKQGMGIKLRKVALVAIIRVPSTLIMTNLVFLKVLLLFTCAYRVSLLCRSITCRLVLLVILQRHSFALLWRHLISHGQFLLASPLFKCIHVHQSGLSCLQHIKWSPMLSSRRDQMAIDSISAAVFIFVFLR